VNAPSLPVPENRAFLRALRRQRALWALVWATRKKSRGLRVARAYAFGVFLSYALLLVLFRGADQAELARSFVRAALEALSLVVGALSALGAAQASAQAAEGGVSALAEQHGFSRRALLGAEFVVAARRIVLLVGLPGLALVVVALACGQPFHWAFVTFGGVLLYATLLGTCLAALAQAAAELWPAHPRTLLSALVVVPYLLAQLQPNAPNLPDFFGSLLDHLVKAGPS